MPFTRIQQMLDGLHGRISFHMPGHKGRNVTLNAADDITELPVSDDLHQPTGAFAAFAGYAAKRYGSAFCFPLVGGGTLGIQAMLLSALYPGDALLLARNAHLSAWSACVLGGLRPLSIYPKYLPEQQLATLEPEDVLRAMRAHPQARAVLLTRPDYYGNCMPLEEICALARRLGMWVLVDEAHGAHFPFLDKGPVGAGGCGADAWTQSLHKTLPALTQTALVHTQSGEMALRMRRMLRLLETSSPSFLLMRSAEAALEQMEREGGRRLAQAAAWCGKLADQLDPSRYRRIVTQDPVRLVIDVRGTGRSGYAVEEALARQGVDMEMADCYRIVGIVSSNNRKEDFDALGVALHRIPAGPRYTVRDMACAYGEAVLPPREAALGPVEWIPLGQAAGRVAAASLGVYPPGIPLVVPGERITRQVVQNMQIAQSAGGALFGMEEKGVAVCMSTR